MIAKNRPWQLAATAGICFAQIGYVALHWGEAADVWRRATPAPGGILLMIMGIAAGAGLAACAWSFVKAKR